jgi:hypothetical protein
VKDRTVAVPSEAHLLAFGKIIHHFAKVETGLKLMLSAVLRVHMADALVIFNKSSPTSFSKIARSLAQMHLRPDLAASFCAISEDWASMATLRNHIAHSTWTNAARKGAIKPSHVSTNSGTARWRGAGDDEPGYTAAELETAAYDLHLINERLKTFSRESGLHSILESISQQELS